jgi:hypothetical protein
MNNDSDENLPESGMNSPKSGEIWLAFVFLFLSLSLSSDLFRALNCRRRANLAGNMVLEKRVHRISLDSGDFVGLQPIFQILPDSGKISPELLFMVRQNHC